MGDYPWAVIEIRWGKGMRVVVPPILVMPAPQRASAILQYTISTTVTAPADHMIISFYFVRGRTTDCFL